jgi:biotin carboxylase
MSSAAEQNRAVRLMLLLPKDSYRSDDFLAAASKLGIDVIQARNQCHQLADYWGLEQMLALPFDDPDRAARIVQEELADSLPLAVLGVDDQGIEVAAAINAVLGLSANAPEAVATLRDKYRFRQLQLECGLPVPRVLALSSQVDPGDITLPFDLPCVVKPSRLSGSRGVVRADTPVQLVEAVSRVRAILRSEKSGADSSILVEQYLPGSEHALEGLMVKGRLKTLALFDKPDPLEGPCFAETIYVSPSNEPTAIQQSFMQQVEVACRHAGVQEGPIHAEARVDGDTVTLLEVAPRSIGGLCGRTLRHTLGMMLEELILRHAIGQSIEPAPTTAGASGVMMLPVASTGVFDRVEGLATALAIPGIESIEITALEGERVQPLPEASIYLGFIFASASTADEVTAALRQAFAALRIIIKPLLEVSSAAAG